MPKKTRRKAPRRTPRARSNGRTNMRGHRYMTRADAVAEFRDRYPAKTFRWEDGRGREHIDRVARRTTWNDFVDDLIKDHRAPERAGGWTKPFVD